VLSLVLCGAKLSNQARVWCLVPCGVLC